MAAGTFDRTYTNTGTGALNPSNPATLSAFNLDEYLVTVGRFRSFVSAVLKDNYTPQPGSGKHTHLNGTNGLLNSYYPASPPQYEPGWMTAYNGNIQPSDENLTGCGVDGGARSATWTDQTGDHENLPIDCVNWYEAYAFCIWDGGFLPSEAEKMYAAAGGAQQREYAWGDTAPGSTNQYAIWGNWYLPVADGGSVIAPVGYPKLGAGLWGQLDLAGDLNSWLLDYADGLASGSFVPGGCNDCAYLPPSADAPPLSDAGAARTFHGGSGSDNSSTLNPWHREWNPPTVRKSGIGVRCARVPLTDAG